jgi:hypothetical protein
MLHTIQTVSLNYLNGWTKFDFFPQFVHFDVLHAYNINHWCCSCFSDMTCAFTFKNSPANTKYHILRTIGQYFFPLNTLASTYHPHWPMQGWFQQHTFFIVYILLYNTILNWFSLTLQSLNIEFLRLSKSNNLSSVQVAIHFYYMPLLYIMGKNIINNNIEDKLNNVYYIL